MYLCIHVSMHVCKHVYMYTYMYAPVLKVINDPHSADVRARTNDISASRELANAASPTSGSLLSSLSAEASGARVGFDMAEACHLDHKNRVQIEIWEISDKREMSAHSCVGAALLGACTRTLKAYVAYVLIIHHHLAFAQ